MSLFLLVLHLTSTVHGTFAGETPPPVHETEEDNFTLTWDSLSQTDTSLTNMVCFLLLSPPKVLYEMINGAEAPESQDGQFSGRVQCDGDALREGRLRLRLSRLRTEDSGSYRCDLIAGYNQALGRWELQTSVTFVLNVTKTSHGDMSASLNTPKPPLGATPDKQQLRIFAVLVAIVLLALVASLMYRFHVRNYNNLIKYIIICLKLEHSADPHPSTSVPDVQDHLII